MSILTDSFPESVTVSGVEYPIHADFHTVLRCFEIQGRKAELSEDDLLFMLRLFYNVKRMTVTEEHIDLFVRKGKGEKEISEEDCRDQ